MDFGALPPEVNSARMYAGPGPGPLQAAAAAWAQLATELASAANSYQLVVAELTGEEWLGPAAESMAAAATPYAAWLAATGAQAEQAATQATAAASAFTEAYAAIVPPPVIAANRSQLAALTASNIFGQNSTAIAATEAQYGEMWVQDAAVMYGYAGQAAAAATVPSFTEPPPTTTAAGTGAGSAHTQLSQLMTAIPQALRGTAPTAGSPALPGDAVSVLPGQAVPATPTQAISYVEMAARTILPANDTNISILYGQVQYSRNLNIATDIATAAPPALGAGLSAATGATAAAGSTGFGGAGPAVSAGLGSAGTVGKLTVPPGWAAAAPEATMTAAAPTAAASGSAALFADMALAVPVGRAIAGKASRSRSADAQTKLEHLAGELTETHQVQHWHTDSSNRKRLLKKLSQQPGVHTVHFDPDSQPEPEPGQ